MTNPTSTGSTGLGIHQTPTQTASIKARHGKRLKSIWTTAAPWFSNTPDAVHLSKTTAAKKLLGKAVLKAMFATNEFCRKTSDSLHLPAFYGAFFISEFQFSAFQHFSFTQSPLFPRKPLFPALRYSPTAVSGASRKKQIPSSGEFRSGSYQELARGFGLRDYTALLASDKANEVSLMTATEFGRKLLRAGEDVFSESLLRHALFAIREAVKSDTGSEPGRAWLKAEVENYWSHRKSLIAILQYLSRFQHSLPGWDQDAKAASLLAGALENDH